MNTYYTLKVFVNNYNHRFWLFHLQETTEKKETVRVGQRVTVCVLIGHGARKSLRMSKVQPFLGVYTPPFGGKGACRRPIRIQTDTYLTFYKIIYIIRGLINFTQSCTLKNFRHSRFIVRALQ